MKFNHKIPLGFKGQMKTPKHKQWLQFHFLYQNGQRTRLQTVSWNRFAKASRAKCSRTLIYRSMQYPCNTWIFSGTVSFIYIGLYTTWILWWVGKERTWFTGLFRCLANVWLVCSLRAWNAITSSWRAIKTRWTWSCNTIQNKIYL